MNEHNESKSKNGSILGSGETGLNELSDPLQAPVSSEGAEESVRVKQ